MLDCESRYHRRHCYREREFEWYKASDSLVDYATVACHRRLGADGLFLIFRSRTRRQGGPAGLRILYWSRRRDRGVCLNNAELTKEGYVRPDGKFSTRLVEDLQASGKTPTQLARDIEQAYSRYVKDPVVSVMVNGFVGVPEQQVRVVGEVIEPRSIPFRKHMTLLDLMLEVGGLTEFADGNDSVLVRASNGAQSSYSLRLDDLLKDGDISANLYLQPGDIIIISESWF